MHLSRIVAGAISAITILVGTLPARAQSIDTTWLVVGFHGEPWFIDPVHLRGSSQMFNRGFADGVFFSCNFAGLSATYTTYTNADFLANPEFSAFQAVEDGLALSSERVFVHRITCEGKGDPQQRRVLYPFVTNEAGASAWYLFEGGVFTLFNPSNPQSTRAAN